MHGYIVTLPVAPRAFARIIAGDAHRTQITCRRANASRHRRETSGHLVLGSRADRRDGRKSGGKPDCRARASPGQSLPATAPSTQTRTPSPTSCLIPSAARTFDLSPSFNSEIDNILTLLSIVGRQLCSKRAERRLATCRTRDLQIAQLMSMHTFSGRSSPMTLHVAFAVVMPYSGRNAKTTVRVMHPDGRRRSLVTRPGSYARSKPPEEVGSLKVVPATFKTSRKILVLFKPS